MLIITTIISIQVGLEPADIGVRTTVGMDRLQLDRAFMPEDTRTITKKDLLQQVLQTEEVL